MWSQSFENDCRLFWAALDYYFLPGVPFGLKVVLPLVSLNLFGGLGDFPIVFEYGICGCRFGVGTIPFAVRFNVGHPYVSVQLLLYLISGMFSWWCHLISAVTMKRLITVVPFVEKKMMYVCLFNNNNNKVIIIKCHHHHNNNSLCLPIPLLLLLL